jgi:uncharacterized protein
MKYEWDETKRAENFFAHQVDFTAIEEFGWETALIIEDIRWDYGERRYIAYGYIEDRLHCAVFTRRNENIRLISLRKANKREVSRYEKEP